MEERQLQQEQEQQEQEQRGLRRRPPSETASVGEARCRDEEKPSKLSQCSKFFFIFCTLASLFLSSPHLSALPPPPTSDDDGEGRFFFSLRSLSLSLARLALSLSLFLSLPPPRAWPRARERAPGAPLHLEREREAEKRTELLASLKSESQIAGKLFFCFTCLHPMQRVKVYRLNPEGLWDDKGTGSVSVEYLEV